MACSHTHRELSNILGSEQVFVLCWELGRTFRLFRSRKDSLHMRFSRRRFLRKKTSYAQDVIRKDRAKFADWFSPIESFLQVTEPRPILDWDFRFQHACECCKKNEYQTPAIFGYLILKDKSASQEFCGFRICLGCISSFRGTLLRRFYSWHPIHGHQDLVDTLNIEDVMNS